MIGIRVDANEHISLGHLIRCISIADAVGDFVHKVMFITSEKETYEEITRRGYEGICLYNDYRDKNDEIDELLYIIALHRIRCLLVDSYEVTATYMEKLNEVTNVAYIDDFKYADFHVNTIINYAVDAAEDDYVKPNAEQLLLGSKYTPLRRDFVKIRKKRNLHGKIKSIFLSTGGTDKFNAECKIIDMLVKAPEFSDVTINAVVGKYHNHPEISRYENENGNVKLYRNSNDIWNVMDVSDVAISASGTTIAELCSAGIPCINFISADNQKKGADALVKANAVIYAGNIQENIDTVLEEIQSALKKINRREIDYVRYSVKGMEMYDLMGARRIAEKIRLLDN